ncbi:PAS domain-containing protein [Methylobacterium haplocladii]|nr:PAS domain-containing protein [Methylobacterium haplocladii]GLS58391.1 hypothetical protein GCM10007887_10510 [Methylobacterium haplocladii]
MPHDLQSDISAIESIEAVPSILEVVCRTTGMGFAAVARVTEDRWVACAVKDDIAFGLKPGGELKVETTICREVRQDSAVVVIDHASINEAYRTNPTPVLYGFESYVSMPIVLSDGTFFGTLCAIDPRPARVNTPETLGMFKMFAEIIAFHLDAHRRIRLSTEERDRFRELFAQSPTFMTVLRGREHRFELANPGYMKLIGHRDVLGRTVAEALPDAVEQGFLTILDGVYDSGEAQTIYGIRYAVQAVAGGPYDERFVDVVYQPIRDLNGAVNGIFIEGSDVTDRVKAERRRSALAQLTERLSELSGTDEIAFASSQILGETLVVSRVGYGTIDHDAETLHVERDWNAPGVETLAGDLPLRAYGSFVDSMKRGELISIADVALDERTAEAVAAITALSAQAFVNVPVIERGRLVAMLYVNHAEVRAWPAEDLAFIREVAARTRVAVERSRNEADLRDLNTDLERKVAERSRERTLTWQVSPDLMSIIASNGVFEATNPAWTATLGWSADELRTQYEDLVHPEDRAPSAAIFVEALRGAPVLNFENRYRHKDGDYRWLSWVAVAENGKLFCSARDITEQKKRAEALHLYENIIESGASPICAFDTDYRLIAFNKAHSDEFFRISAYRVRIGDVFPDLFPPDQAPVMRGLMSRALLGETFDVVEEFGDPDIAKPYWEVFYSPLRDADGRIVGAFHFAQDITDRVRTQADLETAQEALRQSQKMEAVGQLTGGLAHDFNNLLAGISGSLELMQTRMQQGRLTDVDRYMTAAQGAAKRAAALTHRLLAFSRRQTLDPKPTDVNRLVSGMHELIQRTVGPAIPVEVVGASGVWPALVDASQLENALLNLCINARDAMPDGGRITIETANKWLDERAARQQDIPEGQYLTLSVTDTGTGMSPEVIARVFEPFFTTKPLGEGTGLGLSMIYGFAQQSGGQVRIYSEIEKGTTVSIYLPRHYGEIDADDSHVVLATLPRSEQGETVLIVDDEPTVRMLVTDILEDLGYTAIEAGDSVAGLKVLQSDVRIDLLVTDVGLPGGMNGRQMADAARVSRPDLKVLFITGYAENSVLGNGHLAPGMAVMTKPFAVETMGARIRSLIEASRAAPA